MNSFPIYQVLQYSAPVFSLPPKPVHTSANCMGRKGKKKKAEGFLDLSLKKTALLPAINSSY